MNLPTLIQYLYGQFSFTGLYSFEFVDKDRNTITEVFLLLPPKTKDVSEPTRATTVPTLGGNYLSDGGNATKTINLSGELFFQYVGSPDNPIARDNSGLENTLTGLDEFFRLRWMLVRYRDYTMTDNARMTAPDSIIGIDSKINSLYKRLSKKVKNKEGALYNEVQLIFHDYDMDDHYFCRVDNFSSKQSDSKHNAIEYTISIECHKPDNKRKNTAPEVKIGTNEAVDAINMEMLEVDFENYYENIQDEMGYHTSFINFSQMIIALYDDINTATENIQAGQTTASTVLPLYVADMLENVESCIKNFTDVFLSAEQQISYNTGDTTLDDVLKIDLLWYYNSLQKTKIITTSLDGVLKSIINLGSIRYESSADDYTLTEEQFETGFNNVVENEISFVYYTVLEGDTSRIIALRELGNQNDFVKILRINNISENDFIDGTLIGSKIKIPKTLNVLARGDDNLVYETDYEDAEKFLFGTDLATGLNKELLLSPTGDLLGLVGIENVYNSIENRLDNNKGSLNVFNPDWGTVSIGDGNAPFLVQVQRYLADINNQIQSDPRVEAAQLNLSKMKWKGEVIEIPTTVYFIGTEETREVVI